MRKIRDATADEIVLAFLRAEIESPRFGPQYRGLLSRLGAGAEIIGQGDVKNAQQNKLRAHVLSEVRGYLKDAYLFSSFPDDVKWTLAELDLNDVKRLKYANHPTWIALSSGSRLVADGANNVDRIQAGENANQNIRAVAERLKQGTTYPELIIVGNGSGQLVMVEGHTRATAYVLIGADTIRAFQGSSPNMARWVYF